MLGSSWWSQQQDERIRFKTQKKISLEKEFTEIDKHFSELSQARYKRLNTLINEGIDKVEKLRHLEKLEQLKKEKEYEKKKHESEKLKEMRLIELKAAKAKAEQEREKRLALAKKVEEERLKIEENEQKMEKENIKFANDAKERELAKNMTISVSGNAEKIRSGTEPGNKQSKPQNLVVSNVSSDVNRNNKSSKPQTSPQTTHQVPEDIQAEFKANQERILWIKTNVKEAMSHQPLEIKKKSLDIKLQLRPKFGQLTNSKQQLSACRNTVRSIFTEMKESGNLLLFQYTLNVYSKMLVEQSESEANVQLQNALPLAMLTILLWDEFPELGDYVIPRIIKHCPQLIGYYCSIETEEGRIRMGWKRDGHSYETQEQYMGRLAGTCAVWACMTQSKLLASKEKPHPYNISHSWTFVARQLNKPSNAVSSVDFALLAAWWDMTALRFSEAFGKQGIKLLNLLWDEFTRNREEPPAMRLRGLGENWKLTGKIDHAWKPLK